MTTEQQRRPGRAPALKSGEWIDDDLMVTDHLGGTRKVDLYLCRRTRLKDFAACKVLRPEFRVDLKCREAVLQEGEMLMQLRHENVVEGYGVELEKRPRIVMEHLRGQTLDAAFLKGNHEAFDLDDFVSVAVQVADALTYVHQRGMLHLDVKPSNVMYDRGHATLFDFSVAEYYSPDEPLRDNAGTRDYMAPEQTHRREVGYPTDVFGLGVVFYRLLTIGARPYVAIEVEGEDGETRRIPDYTVAARPPSEINARVPEALAEVALRAIAPEFADRFRTPEDFKASVLRASGRD